MLSSCALVAQSSPRESTRAAFLKLIDRPRVALAPSEVQEHPFFFDTVWDVMRTIDYLQTRPDVDGVQSFRWGLEHNGWDSRAWTIRDAIDPAAADSKTDVGQQFLRRFYDRVAPGIYGDFDGPSMLALAGAAETFVLQVETDVGHEQTPVFDQAMVAWFLRWLQP